MIFITIVSKINIVTTQDYYSDIDCLMYEIKTKDVYEDFSKDREIFDFSNYSTKSKYYDSSNKSIAGKMKNETGVVAIKKSVRYKPKMYKLLVDDNNEHKKTKGVYKYVVEETHNEYKDVFLIQNV